MSVFGFESYAYLVVLLVMLVIKGFAFISAMRFPAQAYPAASRGQKTGWGIGLGLGFVAQVVMMQFSPINLITLAFLIAALVFIADTRPALVEVTERR